jgi:hypothetical protein
VIKALLRVGSKEEESYCEQDNRIVK